MIVLDSFRRHRDALMAEWSAASEGPAKPGPDGRSLKLAKAQAALDRWLRKQKAAVNKVKKYQRKVRYYEGRIAACPA
jgi:hypothetical protein